MEAKATANYIRMSARKMRLVVNEVRGYEFPEAVDILKNMPKKAARITLKAIKSAAANAKVMNPDIAEEDLYVKKIYVDEGPTWKRYRPRARGRADRILRRTSKLTVVLSDE
ncbi:MAG: 50S ribosomal protein L22 [Candidatus Hydrogenedentota bacterium]|nr:MAG: 50S ribosomal protein L22 [Candidatus Hydrogenedentota bacterium]